MAAHAFSPHTLQISLQSETSRENNNKAQTLVLTLCVTLGKSHKYVGFKFFHL